MPRPLAPQGAFGGVDITNPNGVGDATLAELVNGDHPSGLLKTCTFLANGAIGLDNVTGKMEVVPQSDPDSLKLGPKGDLIFSSGADGTIIDVANPGTARQSVSFAGTISRCARQRHCRAKRPCRPC